MEIREWKSTLRGDQGGWKSTWVEINGWKSMWVEINMGGDQWVEFIGWRSMGGVHWVEINGWRSVGGNQLGGDKGGWKLMLGGNK